MEFLQYGQSLVVLAFVDEQYGTAHPYADAFGKEILGIAHSIFHLVHVVHVHIEIDDDFHLVGVVVATHA